MSGTRLEQWDERYRAGEQVFREPAPRLVQFAGDLPPGSALDLACGPGRNALYLAERGWHVTAVDGSSVAIDILRARSQERGLAIDARIADLEADGFVFSDLVCDLALSCYYLQRSLIPAMKSALRPGGLLILIAHLADPDQPQGAPTRAYPGELMGLFPQWRILHYREGQSGETCHQRAVAELVAEKPR
ncbi:MAG TPA: methyltransferase domain-containing protein [Bryobacteraceae bacterium]|nr:methyltransferase domain-containing protein [Bryobacteraceae bacterium]